MGSSGRRRGATAAAGLLMIGVVAVSCGVLDGLGSPAIPAWPGGPAVPGGSGMPAFTTCDELEALISAGAFKGVNTHGKYVVCVRSGPMRVQESPRPYPPDGERPSFTVRPTRTATAYARPTG